MARNNVSTRLDPKPGEAIDRSVDVEFEFNGRRIAGYQGDTIASALYSSGTRTFSRSFKYHRRRGILCAAGNCPNCLVTVDGEPNVRSCMRPIQQGMNIKHQNAWPSLGLDVLSVLDRFHWLMPVGFYYKALHRPKALWLLARRLIRRVGGLGSIDITSGHDKHYHHRNRHTGVAVVGGGPAGMAAALSAAGQGASVTLIDDQPELGGHLRFDQGVAKSVPGYEDQIGFQMARAMAAAVTQAPNIVVMSNATVFGFYQDNLLGILNEDTLVRLRAGKVVLSTGSYETPVLFEDNDLPGIMLASAARRLVGLYGVRPGNRALVATETDVGYSAALELLDAGVEVSAVCDSRLASTGSEVRQAVHDRGVRILQGHRIVKALGKGRVKAAVVAPSDGASTQGPAERLRCDLICMAGGYQPVDGLLHQAGGSSKFDPVLAESVPQESPAGVLTAGEVNGFHDVGTSVLQGRLAGERAAAEIANQPAANSDEIQRLIGRAEAALQNTSQTPPTHSLIDPESEPGSRTFVCFCEDVSAHDIAEAIDEGFEDIQTLKRYTTVSMGPCQGKMCGRALAGICAGYTGRTLDDIGGTTARPPFQPVPLAALAGPSHMPVKRTPMDRVHRDLGAAMVDAGPWQRAHNYGSPPDECIAVRERVGIIDVSTLGKLEVRGSDAPALLDRIYTHRFSDLCVGRIRYGLMCSDNSTILDDGTVTRLADDRYFVTTTTGNVDLIEEWFNWWKAGSGQCAHVINVTAAYGAVNIAGPKARETVSKLTDIDLSESAFRYMRSAQGNVAGVPCLLLRIGFVGETGWEVHFPAEYGDYMWDAFMEAGREFGIAPFGLEAQRILRLEKGHIIVGQDTDAVSNPLETGSEWVVRFDKEDFIGRGGLVGAAERGPKQKLVGFIMQDGVVPEDGVPVVSNGRPVGRVTSARLSPTIGKGFGLAWVPTDLAQEGVSIEVLVNDRRVPAQVTLHSIYDPDGERLRS